MVGIFKANNPFNPFILFVYGIILKVGWFLQPMYPVALKSDDFLFREFLIKFQALGSAMPAIYPIMAYLLIFTQAVTFNKLVNDSRLMQRPNYLPAMSYLLITSLFPEWNVLSAALIINTLLIWAWARMINLYGSPAPKTTLLNIGFLIGICTFFYFPSLIFAALLFFSLMIMRPFTLQEWIISLLGILTPWYFLLSYLYLTGKLHGYHLPQFAVTTTIFHQSHWTMAAVVIVIVGFLMGSYYIKGNLGRQVVHVRKSWSVMVVYLIVAAFVPFINATHTLQDWILTAVPLSAFIGGAFLYSPKRWVTFSLHWVMVAFVIIISYVVPPSSGKYYEHTAAQSHHVIP